MNGPLNYYRTTKRRHEEELGEWYKFWWYSVIWSWSYLAAGLPSNLRPDLPVLFIWGTKDVTATPAAIRNAGNFVPRLQDITLEERVHWIMVEAKDEVTRRISDWLKGLGEYSKGRLWREFKFTRFWFSSWCKNLLFRKCLSVFYQSIWRSIISYLNLKPSWLQHRQTKNSRNLRDLRRHLIRRSWFVVFTYGHVLRPLDRKTHCIATMIASHFVTR